jgi:hypothetical protein
MYAARTNAAERIGSHTTGSGRPTVKATAYAERIMNGLAAQMLSAAVQQSAASATDERTSNRFAALEGLRVRCSASREGKAKYTH